MLKKPKVKLNNYSRLIKYMICFILLIFTDHSTFGQTRKNTPLDAARELIVSERINDGIVAYSLLAKNTNDAALIEEYAYALALGGVYDAALYQLDRIWVLSGEAANTNFYCTQIFALMGYDQLAAEFRSGDAKKQMPTWIASKSSALLQKYKRKNLNALKIDPEELKLKFKRANELGSQSLYFQSIALFQEIINHYPNEFLPYVGFSIMLEKIGLIKTSLQSIEKAISLVGNNDDKKQTKQFLELRKVALTQKMKSSPQIEKLQLQQSASTSTSMRPQMMAYAGGMLASSYSNLSLRYGYFVSGESNISADFGLSNIKANGSSSNLGLSYYSRKNIFVAGFGLQATFRDGSSDLYYKVSVGLSFMNKKHTASYDIFFDGNKGFNKLAPTIINLSIGRSIYFGKRK
jgi:hypothetical protein